MWIRTPEKKKEQPESLLGDAQLNKLPDTGRDVPGTETELPAGDASINDPAALNAGKIPVVVEASPEEVATEQPVIEPIQLPSPTGFKPFSIPNTQPAQQPAQGGE
jgi:hypothetical protein